MSPQTGKETAVATAVENLRKAMIAADKAGPFVVPESAQPVPSTGPVEE